MMRKMIKLMKAKGKRPFLYMAFTRFLLALCAALLADHFWGARALFPLRSYAFVFLSALFACLAWIAYLRLDGVSMPKLLMKRVNIRKKPTRTYGDLSDHMDDEPPRFEELEDDEKDACCLCADALCCAAFAALSLL